jgi:gas vesicle protein
MRRLLSFLSGGVTGALVGAILAILFAPSSGEQLRQKMQDRVSQARDQVGQAAAVRRAELEEQLAALRAPKKTE